jgi:hypothetical protein
MGVLRRLRLEHYDRENPDEVILNQEGRVTWNFYAKNQEFPAAFEQLDNTGERCV